MADVEPAGAPLADVRPVVAAQAAVPLEVAAPEDGVPVELVWTAVSRGGFQSVAVQCPDAGLLDLDCPVAAQLSARFCREHPFRFLV
ncbi:MAG: hypothetical protein ACREDR_34490 [Blastocatellia bacterium]